MIVLQNIENREEGVCVVTLEDTETQCLGLLIYAEITGDKDDGFRFLLSSRKHLVFDDANWNLAMVSVDCDRYVMSRNAYTTRNGAIEDMVRIINEAV